MRIIPIVKYTLKSLIVPMIFLITFTMLGNCLGGGISIFVVSQSMNEKIDASEFHQLTITAFVIFSFVSFLILSQNNTRFLITRSVSRKEIFTANFITMISIALLLTVLQLVQILGLNIMASMQGLGFAGLRIDNLSRAAPDGANTAVFMLMNFALIFFAGALGYLFGTLFAKWKFQTIAVITIASLGGFALLLAPGVIGTIAEALIFMFTDSKTGLFIFLKNFVAACIVMLISFPIMRRMRAIK